MFTLTYHEGVKILHPEQPYRVVEENEIVYVKQGETVNFSAATSPYCGWTYWSCSDSSVGTIDSTTGAFTPTACGSVTITIDNGETGSVRYENSITVYVVPVVPGEYYLETPLQSDCFIEPMTSVATGNKLTVGPLAEDEDNRLVVAFVPSGEFGYYTIKKEVKTANAVSSYYLGVNTTADAMPIQYYSNASVSSRRFNIELCDSGYYRIVSRVTTSYDKVITANSTTPAGSQLTIQTYTENTSYNDEWIFRRVLPTGGSEKTVDSSFWNNQGDLNCISYALNAICSENGDFIVSFGDPPTDITLPWDENKVYSELCRNAQNHGFLVERIGKYETCPEGYYKIAVAYTDVYDLNSGYHYYRQGINGTWSHKRMYGNISRVDANNKTIFDPETSDRSFLNSSFPASMKNYPYFIGYYAINPGNVLQP